MINLSDKVISPAGLTALNKGLSFVPTTNYDEFNTYVDLQKFFRTLRVREFFGNRSIVETLNTPSSVEDAPLSVQSSPSETTRISTKFRGKSSFFLLRTEMPH